jgi:hypothetical protein
MWNAWKSSFAKARHRHAELGQPDPKSAVAKVLRSRWPLTSSHPILDNFSLAPILARAYDWACKAGM